MVELIRVAMHAATATDRAIESPNASDTLDTRFVVPTKRVGQRPGNLAPMRVFDVAKVW
jgi:hypothetical protein